MIAELLARCRFPAEGTAVTCAVSGGADSLALLALAVDAGLDVTAIHVDHGLRDGSAAEADVVTAAAERFGAAFEGRRVDVAPGGNLEARARLARYAALPPDVLTGHTADDQAETVLLNLMRGAGLDGVAAMAGDPRRPLLQLRRTETRALCDSLGLVPVADEHNDDPAFRRVRVRTELLPLLDAIAERDVVPLLARFADLAADDVAMLDDLAAVIDPTDAKALAAAPVPLARRAIRAWLRVANDSECHPPDAATIDRVLDVARGEAGATDIGGGRRVERSKQRLRLVSDE